MFSFDYLLGEVRIFEGPEAEDALLECFRAVDVVLAIADSDEVRVGHIDINAGNLPALCDIKLELKERLEGGLVLGVQAVLFILVLILLLVFFLFFGVFFHAAEAERLFPTTVLLILL